MCSVFSGVSSSSCLVLTDQNYGMVTNALVHVLDSYSDVNEISCYGT
jgi:hypothetical protein